MSDLAKMDQNEIRQAISDPHVTVSDPNRQKIALDRLQNLVSGLGTSADKKTAARFVFSLVNDPAELEAMYSCDWLAGKVVDVPADDMTREWRQHNFASAEQSETYRMAEEAYEVVPAFNRAEKWARLYGGGAIVMAIDGAGEFWEPLDIRRVKKGSLKWLRVTDRNYLVPDIVNVHDPFDPTFMRPEHYRYHAGPDKIHRSRILFFYGIEMPFRLQTRTQFWGISLLVRIGDAVRNAIHVQDSAASLIDEAKTDVFKIPELITRMGDDEEETALLERIALAQQGKSMFQAVLLDSEEEWDQKQIRLNDSFGAFIERFMAIVSAASDIPQTRLLGNSPRGFQATGESDLRNYYDMVKASQEHRFDEPLDKLDAVLRRSTFGSDIEDHKWEWIPLWQTDLGAQSEIASRDSVTDQSYLDMGVIQPHHVAARILDSDRYPTFTEKDVEDLESFHKDPPSNDDNDDDEGGGGGVR